MTKNYVDAVAEGETLQEYAEPSPEHLVAVGYRAGLTDSLEALRASLKVSGGMNAALFYKTAEEKLASVARKFEERAKELKV